MFGFLVECQDYGFVCDCIVVCLKLCVDFVTCGVC
jgi:hypothetical protein